MCTLFGFQSPAIPILQSIALHNKNLARKRNCINVVAEHQQPLIGNLASAQHSARFDNYCKFVCLELQQNRLHFLFNDIYTSLHIPYEIWHLILQFELDHPMHDIMHPYLLSVKRALDSVYLIPYSLGCIQCVIIGAIFSGFFDIFLRHYQLTANSDCYLKICGAVLFITALIQLLGGIYSVLINYTPTNIVQLSQLKQVFYQKNRVMANEHVQQSRVNNERSRSHSLLLPSSRDDEDDDSDESKLDISISPARHPGVENENEDEPSSPNQRTRNTIECNIQYRATSIAWRILSSPHNQRHKLKLTCLQPWELLISVQKWCNVLYVQNLLYYERDLLGLNTLSFHRASFLQPNVCLILCKPLFVCLLGVQYLTFSSSMVLAWIPYCALLCFLVWRCVFNVSLWAALCWSVIVSCLQLWEISSQIVWWSDSLQDALAAALACFWWTFVLIATYSLVYLCQSSNKILVWGVWPAWLLAYGCVQIKYNVMKKHSDEYLGDVLNLSLLYCLYISMQFMLFAIPKYNDLWPRFSKTKFVIITWIFGWLNVQKFSALYHDPELDLLPC